MSAKDHDPKPLRGKKALIVGGTSGIGLAAAIGLARAGADHVTVVGRAASRGKEAERTIRTEGVEVSLLIGDASRADDVSRIVTSAAATMGGLDIVVNSVAPHGTLSPIDRIVAEKMIDLVMAIAAPPLLVTREAVIAMRGTGGSIINIASDAAKVPTPGEAAVGGGMAAITMFSRTAALEAKRYGVRINVLTPSLVLGTGTASRIEHEEFATKIFEQIARKAALGVPTADEVADLVVFLSGPAASKITGQVISVNGGISAG